MQVYECPCLRQRYRKEVESAWPVGRPSWQLAAGAPDHVSVSNLPVNALPIF